MALSVQCSVNTIILRLELHAVFDGRKVMLPSLSGRLNAATQMTVASPHQHNQKGERVSNIVTKIIKLSYPPFPQDAWDVH